MNLFFLSTGTLVKNFGLCNHRELIGNDLKLLNKCYNSSLSVIEVTRSHILKNSQISYAFIQSKTDAVQLAYYNLIALSGNLYITVVINVSLIVTNLYIYIYRHFLNCRS